MDDEQKSADVKDVPGLVTLVLPEDAVTKLLEAVGASDEGDDDVSGFMLNMGFTGASRLNAAAGTTSTSTSPCTQTTVGNGDLKCDVDEWIQY